MSPIPPASPPPEDRAHCLHSFSPPPPHICALNARIVGASDLRVRPQWRLKQSKQAKHNNKQPNKQKAKQKIYIRQSKSKKNKTLAHVSKQERKKKDEGLFSYSFHRGAHCIKSLSVSLPPSTAYYPHFGKTSYFPSFVVLLLLSPPSLFPLPSPLLYPSRKTRAKAVPSKAHTHTHVYTHPPSPLLPPATAGFLFNSTRKKRRDIASTTLGG